MKKPPANIPKIVAHVRRALVEYELVLSQLIELPEHQRTEAHKQLDAREADFEKQCSLN